VTRRNLEARIDIDATPERIWSVLSNLGRMPEWSPQCRRMRLVGPLRRGAYTVNLNRRGRKLWPSVSKLERYEPHRAIAFRTLTNNSTWSFEITAGDTGCTLTERRLVPAEGTAWASRVIVEHVLGGEDTFDDEMLDGINTTLAAIKAAVENDGDDQNRVGRGPAHRP
jgi:uncharacterized protein YndB with AHSA1/START domain